MTGHIRRRSDHSWELRYELPRDHAGARRTRTETVRGSKKDAQRRLRELLGELDRGVAADPGKLTVGEWLEQWLAECRHTISPKSWQERAGYIRLHIAPALGTIPLARLSPAAIQRWLTAELTAGRLDGRGGLAPQSVALYERALHAALERARRLRLIAVNPCDDVDPPRIERAPITTWTAAQQTALLAAAEDTELYVPLLVALGTGARRAEVLGLAWSNVELDAGLIRIVQVVEETREGVRLKPAPKTKRGRRTIALIPSTVTALRRHRLDQAEAHLRLGLGKPDLLFPRWAASPAVFGNAFTRLAGRIGLRTSIHDARHTHITELLAAGVHPKVVAERVGHSNIAYLIERYGHITPAMNAAAIQTIERALPALG
jgi:integrase